MDLVDLNMQELGWLLINGVEILMDLVDLNTCWNFSRQFNRCRDPYGSRGSKLIKMG